MDIVRVVHPTSLHPRNDTRIFTKECTSLAKAGYEVFLIVSDGLGDEIKNGVNILDVGKISGGRLKRMTTTSRAVYRKALQLDGDIYHFHDPEMLPYAKKIKAKGKKVIFDAHEDLPMQIMDKPYIWSPLRSLVSKLVLAYEQYVIPKFDQIITATPFIKKKFEKFHSKVTDVNNFPILGELESEINWGKKTNSVAYVGAISSIRGIKELVDAMGYTNETTLFLGGGIKGEELRSTLESKAGWANVKDLGFIDRKRFSEVLSQSKAGLLTFHRAKNHINALPNKMFEYMSAGIPVIASDFEYWKDIIEEHECGICVDPTNPEQIAEAIDFIIKNDEEASKMGRNAAKAINEKFNWDTQVIKLLGVYQNI